MGLFDILGGPIKGLVSAIGGIIDDVSTSDEERLEAKTKLKELETQATAQILAHAESLFKTKRDVLVAELQQGDTYTNTGNFAD